MDILSRIRNKTTLLSSSFYLVLIMIQVLLIVLSVIFAHIAADIILNNEEDKANEIAKFVYGEIDGAIERSFVAAQGALNNPEIIKAFQSRDRGRVLEATSSYWTALIEAGFKQFQFHLPPPDSTTFLRVHQPEVYGEDFTFSRPTVVRCNLFKVPVVGLEQGRSGYGFRAVLPVSASNTHIGSLEVGLDFGKAFLEILNTNYPGKWGIYNLIRGANAINDRILMDSINDDDHTFIKNILPDEKVMANIHIDKKYYELSSSDETISLYIPVKNFLNDISVIVKYVYKTEYYHKLREIIIYSIIICISGLIASGFIIFFLYRQITIPIEKLVKLTENIKNFQLDEEVCIRSPLKEIQDLIDAIGSMKKGLQSFQKYVPAQLVRQLIQTNQVANIGGTRKNLTLFFSDVVDFFTASEKLTPKELTTQLSEYLDIGSDVIISEGGTVNQFLGDAIFAFWGAPLDHPDHANAACRAALRFQVETKLLSKHWIKDGKIPFRTRIGLNSGEIIVGNIGSKNRLYYTAVGDAVNLASRLESLNKYFGTEILISEYIYEQCHNDFVVRSIDYVMVKGSIKPVAIYELVAEKGDISSNDLAFVNLFNEAVVLYRSRQWTEAHKVFSKLKEMRPEDKLTDLFIQRTLELRENPPPPDWTGTLAMKEK